MSQFPKQLGPYRIDREIGRGGMGTVFLATHIETSMVVAIKVLSPSFANESGFRVRFEAEIESLKKLAHRNIVRLYGYGEEDGFLYYCMEYVEGMSIAEELLQGRRFSWRETVEIGIQICRALKHAHDHGVIHRDIKPANLLINDQGEVKLSDFGIARLFGIRMTSDGGVIGTAEYMAPEQAEGQSVTPVCDLYSLGGVLYTMLSGRPPFLATSYPEMLHQQKYGQLEPIAKYNDESPAELNQLVEQLLEKKPEDRLPNAAIVAAQLDKLITLRNVSQSPWQETAGFTPPVGRENIIAKSHVSSSSATIAGQTRADSATELNGNNQSDRVNPSDLTSTSAYTEFDSYTNTNTYHEKSGHRFLSFQTGFLFLSLVVLIGLLYYLMQGPTIDQRYDRIQSNLSEATAQELLGTADEIEKLLDELPADDSRRVELKKYYREIELIRLDRNIRAALKIPNKKAELTPLQRIYGERIQALATSPFESIAHLESLVQMHDPPDGLDEKTKNCIALINYQLNHQRGLANQVKNDHSVLIRQSILRAKTLIATDPQAARKICQTIITHYQLATWAKDEVEECKKILDGI